VQEIRRQESGSANRQPVAANPSLLIHFNLLGSSVC
jgi:hypothetical protein